MKQEINITFCWSYDIKGTTNLGGMNKGQTNKGQTNKDRTNLGRPGHSGKEAGLIGNSQVN